MSVETFALHEWAPRYKVGPLQPALLLGFFCRKCGEQRDPNGAVSSCRRVRRQIPSEPILPLRPSRE